MCDKNEKRVIYFPSLSTWAPMLKKGKKVTENYTFKFYGDEYKDYKHPYFLLTAGALYKRKTIRTDLDMEKGKVLVFGDSGGYQIATGALKWDVKLREDIFNWLENNSDVAMNIDIPPTKHLIDQGKTFQDCLDMTIDNMQWFQDHQTGKTDFLNVLQVYTAEQTKQWYEAVKHFKFKGWGIGSANAGIASFFNVVTMFLINKEFENPDFKWFHFLGKTTVKHFFVYAALQKQLNKYYPHVQVTTDSSSPKLQATFGNWYHSVNYRDTSYSIAYFGNKGKTKYDEDKKLPCILGCPICSDITFKEIAKGDSLTSDLIAFHNLFTIAKSCDDITDLVYSHPGMSTKMIGKNFADVLQSIEEVFKHRNDPAKIKHIMQRYSDVYKRFELDEVTLDIPKDDHLFAVDGDAPATKSNVKKESDSNTDRAIDEIKFDEDE